MLQRRCRSRARASLCKVPTKSECLRLGPSAACGGRVVLNSVSEQIRECLRHAEECARKAAELPNGHPSRQDFLELEKRWLDLARSFELAKA
jgi:hypothetical protein